MRTTRTNQYILRSEDRGTTWTVLPGPRPQGWRVEAFERLDELRPIALGSGTVLAMARTPEGHLWTLRSEDDGQTWTDPKPTTLVHPDAPPMLFHLSDGTLAAFHHNKSTGTHFNHQDRSELWVAFSEDGGVTWGEPRFVLANALAPTLGRSFRDHQVSYVDAFVDDGDIHLFVPHRWRQVLHLYLDEDDIRRLPTRADLTRMLAESR